MCFRQSGANCLPASFSYWLKFWKIVVRTKWSLCLWSNWAYGCFVAIVDLTASRFFIGDCMFDVLGELIGASGCLCSC